MNSVQRQLSDFHDKNGKKIYEGDILKIISQSSVPNPRMKYEKREYFVEVKYTRGVFSTWASNNVLLMGGLAHQNKEVIHRVKSEKIQNYLR